MKCNLCNNYIESLDTCKFCHFEYDEDYNPVDDSKFDILNMREEDGWEHIQIRDRLHYKGIDCYQADIWFDDDVAYLMGCYASQSAIAEALGVHEEVVYCQVDHGFVILNLYKEKILRAE